MAMVQNPYDNSIHLSSSLGDLVVQKDAADGDTFIFEIKRTSDNVIILSERYYFHSDRATIKNIGEVVDFDQVPKLNSRQQRVFCEYLVLVDGKQMFEFKAVRCTCVVSEGTPINSFASLFLKEKTISSATVEYVPYMFSKPVSIIMRVIAGKKDSDMEVVFDEKRILPMRIDSTIEIGSFVIDTKNLLFPGYKIRYVELMFNNSYRRFNIRNALRREVHFVFENSFGCMESISCFGSETSEFSNERKFGWFNNNYRSYSSNPSIVQEVTSGYISTAYMALFFDLLKSRSVFLLEGETWVPVAILEESATLISLPGEPNGISFKYRRSARNTFVANLKENEIGIFDPSFDTSFS